jgi:hypothetical protein
MKEPEPAGTQSKHGLNAEQEKVVQMLVGGPSPSRKPRRPSAQPTPGGPGGRPPGINKRGGPLLCLEHTNRHRLAWARRDLNPHILSDTRT